MTLSILDLIARIDTLLFLSEALLEQWLAINGPVEDTEINMEAFVVSEG